MSDLDVYRKSAGHYRPDSIRVLFIAESPPAFTDESRRSYFYFPQCHGSDILFATMMKAVLDTRYFKRDGNKAELLEKFRDGGYWLMDAVEYPINRLKGKKTSVKDRASEIESNLPFLLRRLDFLRHRLIFSTDSGIILIKKVVFEVLEQPLTDAGYTVLHRKKIDFPKYHRDRDTIAGIRRALAGLQSAA